MVLDTQDWNEKDLYNGESSYNAYTRGGEHLRNTTTNQKSKSKSKSKSFFLSHTPKYLQTTKVTTSSNMKNCNFRIVLIQKIIGR